YWNPASISGLGHSEMEFGIEFLYPRATLSSHVAAGSLGFGVPRVPLTGSTGSDSGVFPLPSFGLVYQPPESPWTLGVGLFAVGGFAVNYPSSVNNPFLTPQPPNGVGVGNLFAQYQILQLTPTVAYQLTEHLSVGAGLTADLASLLVDPF